jgi:hypothetical protein
MNFNDQIKSKLLVDFDKRLKTELSTDLYSFVATVRLDKGDSFHDAVDVIFRRDGATGLRSFLNSMIELLEDLQAENKKCKK